MFSSGMAMPYFSQLISSSRILYFLLSIPSSIFSYLIAILLVIFFSRLFLYFFWTFRKERRIKKVSQADLEKISATTSEKLPFFTVFIPALDESEVIANTILKMGAINYPGHLYQVQVVVDEKERLRAQPNRKTTRMVVEEMIEKCKTQLPELKLSLIEVPYDFDGKINGQCLGAEVSSTKGRALNYALSHLPRETDFCVFFDAEAGPNPDSFLAVAKSYLSDPQKQAFQLPIYQIRNFWSLSPFCKVAALGQCFSHQYALPFIFLFIPFIGGTNVFIQKELILKSGGFDDKTLTEDIEMGVRLYTDLNQWPVFLAYPSTEQTPATMKAYYRQRFRWGYGLMQTLKKLIQELKNFKNNNADQARKRRIKRMIVNLILHGPVEWMIYYPLTLAAALLFVLRVTKMIYSSFLLYQVSALTVMPWNPLNDFLSLIIVFIPLPTLIFLLILLRHYWPRINFSGVSKKQVWRQLGHLMVYVFFIAPVIASYYVFPYISAFAAYLKNPQRRAIWVKTKRTRESI